MGPIQRSCQQVEQISDMLHLNDGKRSRKTLRASLLQISSPVRTKSRIDFQFHATDVQHVDLQLKQLCNDTLLVRRKIRAPKIIQ